MWPTWPDFANVARAYTAATGKPFLDQVPDLYPLVLGQQRVGFFTEGGELAMQDGRGRPGTPSSP